MFDPNNFALSEMIATGAALRALGDDAHSLEEVAQATAEYFRDNLVEKSSGAECGILARLYITRRGRDLPLDLRAALGAGEPDTTYLVLLGTAGVEDAWNDRHRSRSHRALSLASAAAIEGMPMVHQLIDEIGLDRDYLLQRDPKLTNSLDSRRYGVFHVADTVGDARVPDQEFVRRYEIKSAVGCGGALPSGDFFALVLFSSCPISAGSAEQFGPLAISIKLAILPFAFGPVFRRDPEAPAATAGLIESSRLTAVTELLEIRDLSVNTQAARLEAALSEASERANELALSRQLLAAANAHSAHIVSVLQRSLLPAALPVIAGVEVAAAFHPAGDGIEIGGDFYDVFQTGPHNWSVAIGDVCGKGSEAAAVTSLARYTIRAAAMQTQSTAEVVALLNRALIEQRSDRWCTVVYANLRISGEFVRATLTCGGHPLPLLVSPDGTVVPVGQPGLIAGIYPDHNYTSVELELAPGQRLVLYTDGVTDARRENVAFGEERLLALLRTHCLVSVEDLVRTIESTVLNYGGAYTVDDIAILVLGAPAT